MRHRILVVEDDGFTRMLLCSQLRELGHEIVGEAANCAEGMASMRVSLPDLVLADLNLGVGPNGVDLAHKARRIHPEVGILMLTSYVDIRLIGDLRPLPTGAVFMVKRSLTDADALQSALSMSIDWRASPSRADLHGDDSLRKLRDGQVEIMRLVACGYTNAEIATQRYLREASVAKAITRLLQQLGLPTRSDRNPRILITQAYFALIAGSPVPRD